MAWIPYGDSGTLGSVFDSSDIPFGSIIFLLGQTKTTTSYIELDSDTRYGGSSSLVSADTVLIIDSEGSVSFTYGAAGASTVAGEPEAAVSGPTQVWIG